MSGQLPILFGRLAADMPVREPSRARRTDPATAHEAAAAVAPRTPRIDGIILAAPRAHPAGLTSLELAQVTGLPRVTVSPCLRPLTRAGYVIEGPSERRNGAPRAIVWLAAPVRPQAVQG